jgi:hypothetical protein
MMLVDIFVDHYNVMYRDTMRHHDCIGLTMSRYIDCMTLPCSLRRLRRLSDVTTEYLLTRRFALVLVYIQIPR